MTRDIRDQRDRSDPIGETLRAFTGPGDERDAATWSGASTMPSLKSLGIAWWQDWAKQSPW